ncbi:Uncharacterized protein XB16_0813 [Leptospira santarosai]|uniref:Uncharacterized protein n=1 Tax=Leptospira santarosai TaxID=28183 RepID=A0A2P1QQH4_9LEPT|nr:Uncharacterized protein XB16_0813 [Leptospira santarosai]
MGGVPTFQKKRFLLFEPKGRSSDFSEKTICAIRTKREEFRLFRKNDFCYSNQREEFRLFRKNDFCYSNQRAEFRLFRKNDFCYSNQREEFRLFRKNDFCYSNQREEFRLFDQESILRKIKIKCKNAIFGRIVTILINGFSLFTGFSLFDIRWTKGWSKANIKNSSWIVFRCFFQINKIG